MWLEGIDCYSGFRQWLSSHGIVGFSINLIVFFVLIFLLYKLIRVSWSTPLENRDVKDSLALLNQRLANGSISLEDYQKIQSILQQGR